MNGRTEKLRQAEASPCSSSSLSARCDILQIRADEVAGGVVGHALEPVGVFGLSFRVSSETTFVVAMGEVGQFAGLDSFQANAELQSGDEVDVLPSPSFEDRVH